MHGYTEKELREIETDRLIEEMEFKKYRPENMTEDELFLYYGGQVLKCPFD